MTDAEDPGEANGTGLVDLLNHIKETRGFDFSGYKRASLTRRIRKRMEEVGAADYAAYRVELEKRPDEFTDLFNTVLINVTSFLRDTEAWDYLTQTTIPALLADKAEDDPIRVWSAGCASGQEAYSIAIVLAEVLGEERFRRTVKLYATDVDDDALVTARHGVYASKDLLAAFPAETVSRYFEEANGGLGFRKDLRRALIFGRHDLVQDPPISRVDLLVCRNTLMYFTADTQRNILSNFHFALSPTGYLFLGKSEALITRSDMFSVEDIRFHVFSPRPQPNRTPRQLRAVAASMPAEVGVGRDLIQAAVESSPVAQIIVDSDQRLLAVNRHARSLFGIAIDQVGQPFRDLQLSYRPVELRSILERVMVDWRPATLAEVEFETSPGVLEYLEIHVTPIGQESLGGGTSITFLQVGRYRALREELERSQRELETAYEELQSTVEELETTNEELQSTNEELETTNEELHSTNEELETMNEELQSTNEELETINDELEQRSTELDNVNSFLESILSSLAFGVTVLTAQMEVRVWNRRAEDMWGLRADEVQGQHFLNLDIGLPVDNLRAPVRRCLTGTADMERVRLEAVNRRGRPIVCEVTILPQKSGDAIVGAIVIMQVADEVDPPTSG